MKRRKVVISVLAVLLLAVAAVGCYELYLRYKAHSTASVELPEGVYSVYGIDISSHNGNIDLQEASRVVDFVFIKATEGATWKDDRFEDNYHAAKKAGLKTGAYHFFRFNRSGEAQAVNVMEAIAGKDLDFPLVIDVEEHGNNVDIEPQIVINRLTDMVKLLQRRNIDIMFYTNKKGYYKYISDHFAAYPLWICSFSDPPIGREWTFWQYSHEGTVAGYKQEVDLNVYNGDAEQFEAFIEAFKNK